MDSRRKSQIMFRTLDCSHRSTCQIAKKSPVMLLRGTLNKKMVNWLYARQYSLDISQRECEVAVDTLRRFRADAFYVERTCESPAG